MAKLSFRGGVLSTVCSLLLACNEVLAGNPWASEVGEARSVQSKTEDIAERLSDDFPFSDATRPALHLDNIARQLESAVKSGCRWEQIQSLLQQTCAAGQQVHLFVANDCHARADRRLTGYFSELNQRLDRLDQELLKAYHEQNPPVCLVPAGPVHVFPNATFSQETYRSRGAWIDSVPGTGRDSHSGWNAATEFYRQERYRGEIPADPRGFSPRDFGPRDFGPREFGPQDLGPMPSPSLPPGSQIGPIQYRTQVPNRNETPVARQLLSTVLAEIANRL